MTPNRSRFVTACQQLLALGFVLAALTPAASIVTLDVVGTAPAASGVSQGSELPTAVVAGHPSRIRRVGIRLSNRPYLIPGPGLKRFEGYDPAG